MCEDERLLPYWEGSRVSQFVQGQKVVAREGLSC